MAGNLYDILPRKRPGSAHDGEQHFIHELSFTLDMSKLNCVRGGCGRRQRSFSDRHKTMVRDRKGLRARDPDYRQSAFAKGGGNGGYGIVEHRIEVTG